METKAGAYPTRAGTVVDPVPPAPGFAVDPAYPLPVPVVVSVVYDFS